MTQSIVEFFSSITHNDYLTLFLISIIPIIELRGAIVIMTGMTDINAIAGMFCCIAGSTVMILPIILLIRPMLRKMKQTKWFRKLGNKLEENLADRAEAAKLEELEEANVGERGKKKQKLSPDAKKFIGLFTFVAIPLPLTGAWTGSALGGFLDFKVWKAALAVFLGNIVAGAILTGLSVVIPENYVDIFLYGFVVLAVAIAVMLFFGRSKRKEKKIKEALEKYGDRNKYELEMMKKEADEMGETLIKKEYIDDNGDVHIIIGRDGARNNRAINDKDEI